MKIDRQIKFVIYFLTAFFIIVVLGLVILNATTSKYPSISISGRSMEPTIKESDTIYYDPHKIPSINDIIVFDCLVEKCNGKYLIKRIIKIDQVGNYWVEGDNKEHSFDSRNYGWLSPSEIDISGVVHKL